jgi:hypothetical protein
VLLLLLLLLLAMPLLLWLGYPSLKPSRRETGSRICRTRGAITPDRSDSWLPEPSNNTNTWGI